MKRLVFLLTAACAVGPDYQRPKTEVPQVYRGAAAASDSSLGDQDWREVFRDPALAALIQAALEENYDVLIAGARIEQAEAQLGIRQADQLPQVSAGLAGGREHVPANAFNPQYTTNFVQATAGVSWQLDFWGKFRRASEAARADLMAAGWSRRAVIVSLVAGVASAWYQLLELDLELAISRRALASRQESLQLTQELEARGAASLLDVRQAEQLVYNAAQTIIDLQRRAEQQETFISVLLARNPGAVARSSTLLGQHHAFEAPAGLPSSLLERRPDIQLQEARLIAANARIGVARAAFFPSVTLTAEGGAQSTSLSDLVKGPAGLWSFAGSLTQPIFEGGRLRSGVKLAEAQQKESLIAYRQTIQQAFREVSDALIASRRNREFREQQELLADSTKDALALSDQRYRGGSASYLEVLDGNTRELAAELGLARAHLGELLAFVQLYAALGGGWRSDQPVTKR